MLYRDTGLKDSPRCGVLPGARSVAAAGAAILGYRVMSSGKCVTYRARPEHLVMIDPDCGYEGHGRVAGIAEIGGRGVPWPATRSCPTIVAGDAGAKHVVVVHRNHRPPGVGEMAGAAAVGGIWVIGRLAGIGRTGCMAKLAGIEYLIVIDAYNRSPSPRRGRCGMAGIAAVGGLRVECRFSA